MQPVGSVASYLPLLLYSLGMVIGQILLKQASLALKSDQFSINMLYGLLKTPVFYAAIAWYGLMTIVWVWLLAQYPLSRAYPWVALALVITPLFGVWLYGEPFSWRLVIGLVVIASGVMVIADGKS